MDMDGMLVEHIWNMYETCVEDVYTKQAWNVYRIWMPRVRNMYGQWMAYVWYMNGICMEYVWNKYATLMEYVTDQACQPGLYHPRPSCMLPGVSFVCRFCASIWWSWKMRGICMECVWNTHEI